MLTEAVHLGEHAIAIFLRGGGPCSFDLVTPVEQAWVEHAMPDRFETRTEVRFDESLGAPAEFEERLFDGIVVGQVVRPLRGRDAKAAAHEELAARVASGELRPASWDESVEQ